MWVQGRRSLDEELAEYCRSRTPSGVLRLSASSVTSKRRWMVHLSWGFASFGWTIVHRRAVLRRYRSQRRDSSAVLFGKERHDEQRISRRLAAKHSRGARLQTAWFGDARPGNRTFSRRVESGSSEAA